MLIDPLLVDEFAGSPVIPPQCHDRCCCIGMDILGEVIAIRRVH